MKLKIFIFLWIIFFLNSYHPLKAGNDWPMWRYDKNRSASTSGKLADELYLQWQAKFSVRIPVWDDPLNRNLMQFDRILEPVVADNKIFVGFNDQDKVVAMDINTGKEIWHFYADGPVRLPLTIYNGKIVFTGDDGYCYCLNTSDGSIIWKRFLAPAENKLLGNKRLISMWPARGGIVLEDDIIYTAASIFPLMGTFIYALDAETGDIIWKNEGTGSNYILQPHNSPAFADVAPQGTFTISGDKLLVAGGRSVPAAFDKKSGEKIYYRLAASGKTGGAFTCANDKVFFNHHRWRETWMYDAETYRFLNRVWRLVTDCAGDIQGVRLPERFDELEPETRKLRFKTHATIKKVSEDIRERFNFNTAISAIMELSNMLHAYRDQEEQDLPVLKEAVDNLIILLSPFSPHICEELWKICGHEDSICHQSWPRYDETALVQDELEIAIQISGKVRERMIVPTG
ncbi:MAG: class I tRNA ligase family protein, partial [Prolixibacteraceae bacterium]|nr:class I tRNA ligase family protein [Prolixibacteraceae bacterium]